MSDPSPVKAIMDIIVEAASAASTIGEGCTVEVVLAEEVKRLRASICALRARVAELEQQVADARTESAALLAAVHEIEAGTSCELVTIGAYCERFGDKPIVVHPDRLDGIWRAIKARAEGAMKWAAGALDSRARCDRLEAERDALRSQLKRAETIMDSCNSREDMDCGARWRGDYPNDYPGAIKP